MTDRTAVLNSAKYLRNVRPIDPEELVDYVEGGAHPGVIRQILREAAFELGLFERPDGRFVPIEEGPFEPTGQQSTRQQSTGQQSTGRQSTGWQPTRFPDRYASVLTEILIERYGTDWQEGASGNRLRSAIDRLKADYFHGNDVSYDEDAAVGYAIYHLPDYYAAIGYVLDRLAEPGHLPRRIRVLDVGAGTGGPALGLHEYLFGATGEGEDRAIVDYHAVEPSPSAEILDRLLAETGPNFHVEIHRDRIEAVDPTELGEGNETEWDLVLFGNVLSELSDPVRQLERGLDALAGDGSLVALAPADLETSTGLRDAERSLEAERNDVTVYDPELRLWPGSTPSDRGWSFDVAPDLEPPPFQRLLDEAAPRGPEDEPGRYVNVDVQYSHSILRVDGTRRTPVRANAGRHARMAESQRHVTSRIDLLAVKLSRNLADGDANPLYRIGDGSQSRDHYAVLTRESGLNRRLRDAPYGAVLEFQNGLLLWNDDEEAYNLVVDGETAVDLLAA